MSLVMLHSYSMPYYTHIPYTLTTLYFINLSIQTQKPHTTKGSTFVMRGFSIIPPTVNQEQHQQQREDKGARVSSSVARSYTRFMTKLVLAFGRMEGVGRNARTFLVEKRERSQSRHPGRPKEIHCLQVIWQHCAYPPPKRERRKKCCPYKKS
jgi:hypothetical protein